MSDTQFGKGCHLHLIDGSAFIFRAFHALPPLTRKSDGLPVGAVSGFCNMLQRYVEGNSGPDAATHVAVIFDKGSHTFRNDLYDQYKANRDAMPEDLRPQIPLTRDATRAFNIACEEIEGFEADDIIATLACQARAAGGRVTIVSSDKDLMQLVGGGVEMMDPMKNKRIDSDGVVEKFGVGPERVVDVQALAGDSVDNVPGAPGIGIKTAALLINEFGTLEDLLDRAEEIKQPKRRQTLIEHRAQIELSKRLVALDENMDLPFTLESLEIRDAVAEDLLEFLNQMEFRTLTKRIADRMGVEPPAAPEITAPDAPEAPEAPAMGSGTYTCIRDTETLAKWIAQAHARGYVAVDTETTGLNEMTADLVGVSLCIEPGEAAYVPLTHKGAAADDLFGNDALAEGQIPLEDALVLLRPLLQDPSVLKILQNAKYDMKIFAKYGITLAPIDDTMLLSYAQHAGLHTHGMDKLADQYLNHTPIPIKSLLGSGKSMITFDRVPIDDAVPYAAEDADVTLRLWQILKPRLSAAQVTRVYEKLERPLVPVLAQMERTGIKVDRDTLSRMSNAFAQKMAGLEAEIHELAGQSFNVGSPAQLGEILFDKMGLEGGKKSAKTGKYSTGADVLEDLATEHDLPARVLDWRQLSKLKSTYTDALQDHINPDTGRVHTSYSIAGASTGRLASTDPNLQNIPIRSEEGRRIREAFVADEGKVLVALDYSQIELRILAHVAGIDALKQAFKDGQDIHAITASQMFGVPLDEMTSDVRRQAKAINFGVIYGISGFGLARNLRIPRAEAQAFIDTYFERFPGIRTYMDDTVKFAKEHERVETLFGRKIHTPEINAKGPTAGFAKRAAINAPIQGTAADIIRRAMIRMPAAIADLPAKMLLQVHDELLFEVDEDAVDTLTAVARDIMEGAADPVVHLDVKLSVEAGQGANWAQAH
ncbi:DNA polymerase I [Thalassobacter stenotrophicus]|uniref:DNA polymerase I n=2 Tax=Thalassobacter stenotrophicus TaxID=266809 RepID=A0A0P1EVW9_9RHOB|nr:DNA polymerase I [Thalassobacter stenotrophicus]PVZ50060.1 DNA polymerase I [Thalassobacter stenotrophicus]CUH59167.1 DNA polymerase I [Thalassobacter stenotrophicus]SHI95293.1 DNA polymerase I [Thalassobacter stenotrophicus DSM 16310]